MLPDYEGCFDLLAAVGRQWVEDCRRQKFGAVLAQIEMAHLAAWLGLELHELRRLMTPAQPAQRKCPVCGIYLPGGDTRKYCSGRCYHEHRRERLKEIG